MTRRKTEITATVLWSLATKGTQEFKNKSPQPLSRISEFGFGRNWEFAARTCSLATEGTQEFPPLKKNSDAQTSKAATFAHNFLSLCDNASCILVYFILPNFRDRTLVAGYRGTQEYGSNNE